MTRASRYIYVVTAWAVVVGLTLQVLLIGMGLRELGNDAPSFDLHRGLGWLVHWLPVAVIPFAWLSKAGSRHWQWALASAVVIFMIPIFLVVRGSMPVIGALHPVAAVIGFVLAAVVAVNSVRALNAPMPQSGTAPG